MSRLTSPMNREKRGEKQRCFIGTPSLSVWPNFGQTGGEKDTFHIRRATNKRCMGQPPLTDALHTRGLRTGQARKHHIQPPPGYSPCQAAQSICPWSVNYCGEPENVSSGALFGSSVYHSSQFAWQFIPLSRARRSPFRQPR